VGRCAPQETNETKNELNWTKMATHIYDFQIKVLISNEDGEFIAHALEMDIVAYGKTEKEAVMELTNLIHNQISFALEKGEDHLMLRNAPSEYLTQWEKAHTDALKGIAKEKSAKMKVRAVSICFTKQEVLKRSQKNVFEQSPLVCA